MNVLDLDTGDILLFHTNKSCFGKLIQCCTCSEFSHVGIVLKNPTYIDKKLKGLFLLESGLEPFNDVVSNERKFGVQITRLCNVLKEYGKNNVYVRKLYTYKPLDKERLKSIYEKVKNKPYDINPIDWIMADLGFHHRLGCDTDETFWCSALVGYVYVKMGFLNNPHDWSLLSPEDFSGKHRHLNFNNCYLGMLQKLIF